MVTCCGVGFLSKRCPGTIGSAFASCILFYSFSILQLVVMFLLLFCLGTICSYQHVVINKKLSVLDPGYIVIDEVCGVLLCAIIIYCYAHELRWYSIIINFVLFRIFDITKCFGILNFEKYISKKHHALGIMLDDIHAALYASFVHIVVFYLFC